MKGPEMSQSEEDRLVEEMRRLMIREEPVPPTVAAAIYMTVIGKH